jgi:hypothetical protein
LEEFLSNPWFFHFAAFLKESAKLNEGYALYNIPQTDGEVRLREQCIGEARGLLRYEKEANATLDRLKALQNEPDRDDSRPIDDEY